jgi:hypothetical protein
MRADSASFDNGVIPATVSSPSAAAAMATNVIGPRFVRVGLAPLATDNQPRIQAIVDAMAVAGVCYPIDLAAGDWPISHPIDMTPTAAGLIKRARFKGVRGKTRFISDMIETVGTYANSVFYCNRFERGVTSTLAPPGSVLGGNQLTLDTLTGGTFAAGDWIVLCSAFLRDMRLQIFHVDAYDSGTKVLTLDDEVQFAIGSADAIVIKAYFPQDITIEDIDFTGTGDRVVELAFAVNCRVSNICHRPTLGSFQGPMLGLDVAHRDCTIENVDFVGNNINSQLGMSVESGIRTTIRHTKISRMTMGGIVLPAPHGNILEGGHIEQCLNGLLIGTSGSTNDVECTRNLVVNGFTIDKITNDGIQVVGGCDDIKIDNCRVAYCGHAGINCNADNGASPTITVSNTRVTNCAVGVYLLDASSMHADQLTTDTSTTFGVRLNGSASANLRGWKDINSGIAAALSVSSGNLIAPDADIRSNVAAGIALYTDVSASGTIVLGGTVNMTGASSTVWAFTGNTSTPNVHLNCIAKAAYGVYYGVGTPAPTFSMGADLDFSGVGTPLTLGGKVSPSSSGGVQLLSPRTIVPAYLVAAGKVKAAYQPDCGIELVGGVIDKWADMGFDGHTFAAIDAGGYKRPAIVAAGCPSGRPCLRANADSSLQVTWAILQQFDVILLVKWTYQAGYTYLIDGKNLNCTIYNAGGASINIEPYAGTAGTVKSNASATWSAIHLSFNGASSQIDVNGAGAVVSDWGANAPGGITLFSSSAPNNYAVADMGPIVIGSGWTAADIAAIVANGRAWVGF